MWCLLFEWQVNSLFKCLTLIFSLTFYNSWFRRNHMAFTLVFGQNRELWKETVENKSPLRFFLSPLPCFLPAAQPFTGDKFSAVNWFQKGKQVMINQGVMTLQSLQYLFGPRYSFTFWLPFSPIFSFNSLFTYAVWEKESLSSVICVWSVMLADDSLSWH